MRSTCPANHAAPPHVGTVTAPHSACASIPQQRNWPTFCKGTWPWRHARAACDSCADVRLSGLEVTPAEFLQL